MPQMVGFHGTANQGDSAKTSSQAGILTKCLKS
jgi:hypothetical protein